MKVIVIHIPIYLEMSVARDKAPYCARLPKSLGDKFDIRFSKTLSTRKSTNICLYI